MSKSPHYAAIPGGVAKAQRMALDFSRWHQQKYGDPVPDCQFVSTAIAIALQRQGHQVSVVGGDALGHGMKEPNLHYWLKVDGAHFDPKGHILKTPYQKHAPEFEWTPDEAAENSVENADEPAALLKSLSGMVAASGSAMPKSQLHAAVRQTLDGLQATEEHRTKHGHQIDPEFEFSVTPLPDDCPQCAGPVPSTDTGICTFSADHLAQKHGGRVVGYHTDFHDTRIGEGMGGHDFALLDNDRLLADWWAKGVEGRDCDLYDLHDPAQAKLAQERYGHSSKWEPVPNMDYTMKKSIPGMIAAAGLALASGSAMPTKPAVAPTQAKAAKSWTADGLDPEMHPIAHLESSWGKNVRHATHPKGVFHTAHGAVGMKPVTAHEQYLRSPTVQKLFPGLQKPEAFQSHFLSDHSLYNLTASAHWQWLRKKLGSPAKAAYGWRWGATAAARAPDDVLNEDPYVHKFVQMSATKLGKMAIADVTPGERKGRFVWDYSHLLTPENRMAGYQVHVSFHPAGGKGAYGDLPYGGLVRDRFRGEVTLNGKPVGQVSAAIHTNCLGGPCIEPHSEIQEGHHRRGLGTAMYEGLFKEAKLAGIKTVHGRNQSAPAIALHRALARKHGLGYKAPSPDAAGQWSTLQSEFPGGEFKYTIKSEQPLAKEEESDIRRALSSDRLMDWTMALKRPEATVADLDHLLDRISQQPGDDVSGVGGYSNGSALNDLSSTSMWTNAHTHRAMMLPSFRRSDCTPIFSGLAADRSDPSLVDRMLDDMDVWFPKMVRTSWAAQELPEGDPKKWQRRGLFDLVGGSTTPAQMDKIIHSVYKEGIYSPAGWANPAINDNVPPEFLTKWMKLGIKHGDLRTVAQVAQHAHRVEGLFETMVALPPEKDSNYPSHLVTYAETGKMLPKHFEHLLAHPGSWGSNKSRETKKDRIGIGIRTAIERHMRNPSGAISEEAAQQILRHQNRGLADSLSDRDNLSPEIYRAMYSSRPELASNFATHTACPEDIRLAHYKQALDSGEWWEHIPSQGTKDPSVDWRVTHTPHSAAAIDLFVSHPNPGMITTATRSPNMTTEQALALSRRGYLHQVVQGIHWQQDALDQKPAVDLNAIVSEAAKIPNKDDPGLAEHMAARESMARKGSTWPLSKEFYESVTANELATLRTLPEDDRYPAERVCSSLLDTENPDIDFLRAALTVPEVRQEALFHKALPQQDFDDHFAPYLQGVMARNDRSSHSLMNSFVGVARKNGEQKNPNIQERHLIYARDLIKSHLSKPLKGKGKGKGKGKERDDSEDESWLSQLGSLYRSEEWSPEQLEQAWHENFQIPNSGVKASILKNKSVPDSVLEHYFTVDPKKADAAELYDERHRILSRGKLSRNLVRKLADSPAVAAIDDANVDNNEWDETLKQTFGKRLNVYEPDRLYRVPRDGSLGDPDKSPLQEFEKDVLDNVGRLQGTVDVRAGMQKLRKIRDLIMEKAPETGELRAKDLPPGDWSAGRLPTNGNISAKKLNEYIDSQESHVYNFSHGQWDRPEQRHLYDENHPQKAFQLNLTTDMVDKMESAGVYDTFLGLVEKFEYRDHPIRRGHTLGWVRYDGGKDSAIHVDEVQSDFGQGFIRQIAPGAVRREGPADYIKHKPECPSYEAPEIKSEAEIAEHQAKMERKLPLAHREVIKNILFGSRHPNEMILEAFHQYLRNQGHTQVSLHMLHADTKAPISGQHTGTCKDCGEKARIPAHMQFTYDQLPSKKMGLEPKSYGAIAPQTNTEHVGKPTWGGPVRKFERRLVDWAAEQGIEELAKTVEQGDFRAIARAIDPQGGATVDHVPHLQAHPSGMTEEVNDYRANVLESPTRNRRMSSKGLDGITRKVVYRTKDRDGVERRYMVKPYHEKVIRRVSSWMQHPIQGWAEMANQALYHAAGIGHLHQKVHVSEHPMGFGLSAAQARHENVNRFNAGLPYQSSAPEVRQEPALVVHLENGFRPVSNGTESWPSQERMQFGEETKENVRKIGLMDMLTNNLDRHGLNLLHNPETDKILAVDHSRSFQYKAGSKPFHRVFFREGVLVNEIVRDLGEEDTVGNYTHAGAVSAVVPKPRLYNWDGLHKHLEEWGRTIEEWWPKVSAQVRGALDEQLKQIKNPLLVDHIRRNFHERANLLDQMARDKLANYGLEDWHETEFPIHKYKG